MIKESTNQKCRRRKNYKDTLDSQLTKLLFFKILNHLPYSRICVFGFFNGILVCFLILSKYVCIHNFVSSLKRVPQVIKALGLV